jgi:SAM-dependent methyltransferase
MDDDDVSNYNRKRWNALVQANALYTRPTFDLDIESARAIADEFGLLGDLTGSRVLCLAAGGGKQSAAFALLGAVITVVDLSEAQLERDREVAAHLGLPVDARQGDMRDLSFLPPRSFDVVYHPYSINFVPDPSPVFAGVARVLRPGGRYRLMFANPFALAINPRSWTGEGYLLRTPHIDGEEMLTEDENWVFPESRPSGIPRPREYRHTLPTIMNGLASHGLTIQALREQGSLTPDANAEPGTWDHFTAYMPPWIIVLSRLGSASDGG